jgi:glycosyltransferase involved in cell wall biosynthesis
MRIVYVLTSLGTGGAERQTIALAEWMASRGHTIAFFVLRPRQSEEWPTRLDVLYLDMLKSPRRIIIGLIRARRFPKAFRPDLVHSHTYHANLVARLLKVLTSTQVVSTMHNVYEGGWMRMLAYRLTDLLSLRTTAVSKAVARHAIKSHAMPARKCMVISNAFDITAFAADRVRRIETRDRFGAGDDFIWLAAGRIVSAKGFVNLLKAFSEVWVVHPGTQLWIAGSGSGNSSRKTRYSAFAVHKGTMDRVRRLGLSRDMPALLDAADGFVLASAWEGMPLVVGEAMAMEKPVVATDVGGVGELVGDTAALVAARNADALAEAMLKVMQQTPDTRRAHGSEARARIITHFNTAIRFPEWEALYRSLCL